MLDDARWSEALVYPPQRLILILSSISYIIEITPVDDKNEADMLIKTPKELGIFLRSHRKSSRLSQSDAGSKVGLKQSTISEFENNPATSKIETLFRILSSTQLEMHLIPRDDGSKQSNEKDEWDKPW